MLNDLIALAKAASEIGTVTEAHMYRSGLITLDGATDEGMDFSITYHLIGAQENADGNP